VCIYGKDEQSSVTQTTGTLGGVLTSKTAETTTDRFTASLVAKDSSTERVNVRSTQVDCTDCSSSSTAEDTSASSAFRAPSNGY